MTTIIALILVALVLFFFEVFVPGGILGTIGGVCLITSTVLTYNTYGAVPAIIQFCLSLLFVIFFFFFTIYLLPQTGFGKMLILSSTEEGYQSNIEQAEDDILGKEGKSITTMAPSGTILIDGKRYEATSQTGLLKEGEPVTVVGKDAFKLIVRKLDKAEA